MVINRTKNTIRGTVWGIVSKIISLLFPFIIRTIFIKTLGAEYLGLNSLFVSILQVLNLAELGVGSALVFSMYKPIAEGDKDKICALMNLYKKYYRLIGLAVLLIGIAIIPFLTDLISGDIPQDINIIVIYLMQLFATVLTYWVFAYKVSLFQAFQRVDIVSIITICIYFFQYSLQIVFLLLYKNYYLYLSVAIVSQVAINIVTAIVAKKLYPGLEPQGSISKDEIKVINQKVRDLFTAKAASVVSNSFDTIVVSAFLGLTTLAVYQNYFYIVTAVSGIIMMFFTSLQAGVGNYLITMSKDDSAQLLNNINHIVFFIINICCCCLITLYQPFMLVWVGDEYLLEYPMVVMFAGYLFAYILIRPVVLFKDAAGMWREDRFRPLVSSLINLALNLLTVKSLGLYGVLGSTIISYLCVSFPWVLLNINKYMFRINLPRFVARETMYAVITGGSCAICYFICNCFQLHSLYSELFIFLIVSIIVPATVFITVFSNTKESKYFMQKVRSVLSSIKNKTRTRGKSYIDRYNKYAFRDIKCSSIEGYEAVITRYYHTIEKGLSYVNYRAGFGKANIDTLIKALENYLNDNYSTDEMFYRTALSVLFNYYNKNKEHGMDDIDLLERIKKLPGEPNDLGGLIAFEKPQNTESLNFEDLMHNRHSIRHFSTEPVELNVLKEAIQLAQFTPSACNRQGWKTRIVADKGKITDILANQNGNRGFGEEIDKLLIVTSDLRYFNYERETYQAFIDGGMYAQSVINSLYYYGLASIPLSAALTEDQEKNIRKLIGMNDAEILILLIGVGNYLKTNQTTRSERKKMDIEVL